MSTYLASKPLSSEQDTHLKEAQQILAAKRMKMAAWCFASVALATLIVGLAVARFLHYF